MSLLPHIRPWLSYKPLSLFCVKAWSHETSLPDLLHQGGDASSRSSALRRSLHHTWPWHWRLHCPGRNSDQHCYLPSSSQPRNLGRKSHGRGSGSIYAFCDKQLQIKEKPTFRIMARKSRGRRGLFIRIWGVLSKGHKRHVHGSTVVRGPTLKKEKEQKVTHRASHSFPKWHQSDNI